MKRRLQKLELVHGSNKGEEASLYDFQDLYAMSLDDHQFGLSGLVHVPDEEAFYTPEGELALSRTFCHLERIFKNLVGGGGSSYEEL